MNKSGNHIDEYTNWLDGEAAGDTLTAALDAVYAPGPSPEVARLAKKALHASLATVLTAINYDQLRDTPLGPVWVAAGPRGLVAIEYNGSEENFLAYLQKHIKGLPERSPEKVSAAKEQLLAYLLGKTNHLDLDFDLSSITPFQRRVLEATAKVPRGKVSTYAEIARRIGNPKAVRAVGQALRRNPIPILVPCHRVIASDGTLGGYGGNLRDKRKIQLLKLEGVYLT